MSFSEVDTQIQQGFRIIDLEIESASPYQVSVSLVRNEGAFAKDWIWLANAPEVVLTAAIGNGYRITDLEVFFVNGAMRFAAVLERSTRLAWWWEVGKTASEVTALYRHREARVIDIERYVTFQGERFAVVMVDNSGVRQRPWALALGQNDSQLKALLQQNGMQPHDIERSQNGHFDCVMVGDVGVEWRRLVNAEAGTIGFLQRTEGLRVADIEPRDNDRFDCVLVSNPGHVVSFGAGCATSAHTLMMLLSIDEFAAIGEDLHLTTFFHQSPIAVTLNIGLSTTQWGPVILPFDLGPFGAPGCSVLVDWTVQVPGFASVNTLFTVPIPDMQSLVGVELHFQAVEQSYPGLVNPIGVATSNAMSVTIVP